MLKPDVLREVELTDGTRGFLAVDAEPYEEGALAILWRLETDPREGSRAWRLVAVRYDPHEDGDI